MSAYNADLIRDLEQQFDDEAMKPVADLSALNYLKGRADELINTAVEGLYATRRHLGDELKRQKAKYRPMYGEGRGGY
jgi:hypothetical protein